jgi:hypothetical protein
VKIESNTNVSTNAVSSNFKISENAGKLFMMLSTALYANKERSTLYELSTNAYDEHVISGKKDVPIEITFPTKLDSNIRIRDFGRGLCEDDVYRLLCTYGESTKSQSNDFVGSWGIGFKSCASVSNTWTVNSYHAGKKSQYLIFVSADGIPNITKIRDEVSGETGIEVVIPVQESRYYQWKSEISTLFSHFPVKPIIHNLDVKYPDQLVFNDGGWLLCGNNSRAITSFREYDLDKNKLKTEISEDLLYVLDLSFTLKFEIGELDLSISRETLQYTKKTITAVENKLRLIKDHYTKIISSITGKDSLEYRENFVNWIKEDRINKSSGYYNKSNAFISDILGTNGKFDLKNYPHDFDRYDFKVGTDDKIVITNGKRIANNPKRYFNCWKTMAIRMDRGSDESISLALTQLDNIKFFINDCHGGIARAREYCTANRCYGVIADKNLFPKELKRKIVKTSSLPKPQRTQAVREKSAVYEWSGSRRYNPTSMITLKACYVQIKNINTGETKCGTSLDLIITLRNMGYQILGVKGELPLGAISAKAVAADYINNFDEEIIKSYYQKEQRRSIIKSVCVFATKFKTQKQSEWNDFVDQIADVKAKLNNKVETYSVNDYFRLCQNTGTAPKRFADIVSVDALIQNMYHKYPMLSFVSDYDLEYNKESQKKVGEYIEQLS